MKQVSKAVGGGGAEHRYHSLYHRDGKWGDHGCDQPGDERTPEPHLEVLDLLFQGKEPGRQDGAPLFLGVVVLDGGDCLDEPLGTGLRRDGLDRDDVA